MDKTSLIQKVAVRFAKTGPAIYHSHHDMIRFWERAVKRAGVPARLTQGFNPHPRMIFPHALGVGITSRHEEVELELHREMGLEELARRLTGACGDTIRVLGVENLPPVKKSRQIVASSYRITGWTPETLTALPEAIGSVLAMNAIMVERGAPGDKRSLDIRPYLGRLSLTPEKEGAALDLLHTQAGSARPDEIAKLLAATTKTDWRTLSIEKTGMTLS